MDLRETWNQRWQQTPAPWHGDQHDHDLAQWLQGRGRLRILEIGCGAGATAAWLHDQGHQVTAIDISDQVIAQCHQRWPNQDFRQADALDSTVDLGRFDLVFERGVMVVLNIAQDRQRLAAFARRHVVQAGHFVSVCDCTEGRVTQDPRLSHRSISDIVSALDREFRIQQMRKVMMTTSWDPIPAWFTVAVPRNNVSVV